MVALSQDLTPRNVYGPRGARSSADSYGFPSTHSSASSISSGGNYPYYSASVGSVDSSVTDYSSTTSESYESRTLPRPTSLLAGSAPPGPQSMMSQFSSKMPSNTQKKHKCKVCDKRFTRPSSLQTHMYSHTGEKRKFHLPGEELYRCRERGSRRIRANSLLYSICMRCRGLRASLLSGFQPAPTQEGAQGREGRRLRRRGRVNSIPCRRMTFSFCSAFDWPHSRAPLPISSCAK